MSLVAMGTSFKTSSIDARQRVAVAPSALPGALSELLAGESVTEAVIVSTCNRVEAYVEAKTDRLGSDALRAFFARRLGGQPESGAFYLHRGDDAARHAFRVVCSLDSQVLGEAQILGQMRAAFDAAMEAGACGEMLGELFRRALTLGRRARTETGIGGDSVSLSTVAHRVARDFAGDLRDACVLLVGAGEMAHLTARYLVDDAVGGLLVANRTQERAEGLAREFGGTAVPFDRRHEAAAGCDVVFCMTGAEEPVLRAAELAGARAAAGGARPLLLVDEAVPRDVEPACADIPGVSVCDLEALGTLVDEGLAARMAAVPQVERLVEQAEEDLLAWMQERLVTPTIKGIREKGVATVEAELARAISAMAKERGSEVPEAERRILEHYGNAIMNKILHGPTVRLRKEATTADSYYYTGAARYLFGIDAFPPGAGHPCRGDACLPGGPCPMGVPDSMRGMCRKHMADAASPKAALGGKGEGDAR